MYSTMDVLVFGYLLAFAASTHDTNNHYGTKTVTGTAIITHERTKCCRVLVASWLHSGLSSLTFLALLNAGSKLECK
jgi:hypothetical protein